MGSMYNGLILVFAIGLVAGLAIIIRKAMAKSGMLQKKSLEDFESTELAEKVFQESLAELERNAKGFALYRALLENPLSLSAEEELYAKYGKQLMEPSFIGLSAAKKYESVFDSQKFLDLVKKYLNENGIQPGASRFVVFNQLSDLAMEKYSSEMVELVQRKK